jgi:hypothetical protein
VTSISPERIFLLFGLIIGLTLLLGGGHHFYDSIVRPNKLEILFNKIKDLDLTDIGLVVDLDKKLFLGQYKDYQLTVFADMTNDIGECIKTNVFIKRNDTQFEIYQRLQPKYEFNTKNNVSWFTFKTNMPFGESPKIEKLKKDIMDLVDTLRYERIEPLKVQD